MRDPAGLARRQDEAAALIAEPDLLRAACWLAGALGAAPGAEIAPPLARAGVQDPDGDILVPDWPYPPEGAACEAALERIAGAGLLTRGERGGGRATPLGLDLLPSFLLHQQLRVEDFAGRLPGFREAVAGRRVLDAGCGVGAYSRHFQELGGGRITALDLDSVRVRIARALAGPAREQIEFLHASVAALPLPDRSVDLVFSRVVLPYAPVDQALAEFARVLPPGGLALLMLQAPAFYLRFLRRAGLTPAGLRRTVSGVAGLLGGFALELTGRARRVPVRSGRIHLSYQRRAPFTRLARRFGLEVTDWRENRGKPIAWLRRTP